MPVAAAHRPCECRTSAAARNWTAPISRDSEDGEARTRLALLHNMFGTRLFNRGEFLQAEVEFSMALEYNFSIPKVLVNRGNAAFHQSKFDLAFLDYKRALEMEPPANLPRRFRLSALTFLLITL